MTATPLFTLRVRYRANGRAELVATYAHDALEGGMFVRTRCPPAPLGTGTVARVRFELADGREVLDGVALVAWVQREPSRSGVGLAFLELDPDGAALLAEMRQARHRPHLAPRSQEVVLEEFSDGPTTVDACEPTARYRAAT